MQIVNRKLPNTFLKGDQKNGTLYRICQMSDFCQYSCQWMKTTWPSTYGFLPYTVRLLFIHFLVLTTLSILGMWPKTHFNMISIFSSSEEAVKAYWLSTYNRVVPQVLTP